MPPVDNEITEWDPAGPDFIVRFPADVPVPGRGGEPAGVIPAGTPVLFDFKVRGERGAA